MHTPTSEPGTLGGVLGSRGCGLVCLFFSCWSWLYLLYGRYQSIGNLFFEREMYTIYYYFQLTANHLHFFLLLRLSSRR